MAEIRPSLSSPYEDKLTNLPIGRFLCYPVGVGGVGERTYARYARRNHRTSIRCLDSRLPARIDRTEVTIPATDGRS